MQEVAKAKKSTASGLDGWAWNEIKALLLPWFSDLAILLELVETSGIWPQGLLDAYIAMLRRMVTLPCLVNGPSVCSRLSTGCGPPFGLVICGNGLELYADNLKCSAERPGALLDSARLIAQYVRSVGQDVSAGKYVLLSTFRSVRKAMKLWDVSGSGGFWKVQLDVRDLGGHLDFTLRARAGTLSKRIREATFGVAAVGTFPLGFGECF